MSATQKTCACQPGSVPNGCLQTQLDFLKAAAEGMPFLLAAHEYSPPDDQPNTEGVA